MPTISRGSKNTIGFFLFSENPEISGPAFPRGVCSARGGISLWGLEVGGWDAVSPSSGLALLEKWPDTDEWLMDERNDDHLGITAQAVHSWLLRSLGTSVFFGIRAFKLAAKAGLRQIQPREHQFLPTITT